MASLLLAAGADVTATETKYGSTPLHTAAFNGHADVAAVLLDAGADVGARNANALTPLHYAASNDHMAVVQLLLQRGASARALSREGRTPLQKATGENVKHLIFSALRQEEAHAAHTAAEATHASPAAALQAALVKCSPEDVASALARGAPHSEPDDDGWTPLHYAARFGSIACARLLLSAGAALGARDCDGQTAVQIAGAAQHADVAALIHEWASPEERQKEADARAAVAAEKTHQESEKAAATAAQALAEKATFERTSAPQSGSPVRSPLAGRRAEDEARMRKIESMRKATAEARTRAGEAQQHHKTTVGERAAQVQEAAAAAATASVQAAAEAHATPARPAPVPAPAAVSVAVAVADAQPDGDAAASDAALKASAAARREASDAERARRAQAVKAAMARKSDEAQQLPQRVTVAQLEAVPADEAATQAAAQAAPAVALHVSATVQLPEEPAPPPPPPPARPSRHQEQPDGLSLGQSMSAQLAAVTARAELAETRLAVAEGAVSSLRAELATIRDANKQQQQQRLSSSSSGAHVVAPPVALSPPPEVAAHALALAAQQYAPAREAGSAASLTREVERLKASVAQARAALGATSPQPGASSRGQ